jgi:hypothetical protein
MLAISAALLQTVDWAVLGVGAIVALGLTGRGMIRGTWREPPSPTPPLPTGPNLLHLAATFALFLLANWTAQLLSAHLTPEHGEPAPGSHAWFVSALLGNTVSVLLSCVMVVILVRNPSLAPAPPGSARRLLRLSGAGVLAALAVTPICVLILAACEALWAAWFPERKPPAHPVLLAVLHNTWGAWGLVQLLVGAIVIAPLSEELFFRGVLLQSLWRQLGGAWTAIVLSGAAFGGIHSAAPQTIPALVFMGVAQGWLRLRTQSLWPCIVMHALFNARTIVPTVLTPELIVSELPPPAAGH